MDSAELPIKLFKDQLALSKWLGQNHDKSSGMWLKFAKKNSGETSINYTEAMEEALRYGWIDSQTKRFDEKFYLQKFTPRRSKSIWSKINVDKIEKLIKEGKMMPSGIAQVEQAKADGRWAAAYEGRSKMAVPEDFQKALDDSPKAKEFYEAMSSSNRYAILFRLHHYKKPETKTANINKFIKMLEEGKKFHA
jgi:uncharacterized protein YdeI (YjbR/CyaY-like superfamily)